MSHRRGRRPNQEKRGRTQSKRQKGGRPKNTPARRPEGRDKNTSESGKGHKPPPVHSQVLQDLPSALHERDLPTPSKDTSILPTSGTPPPGAPPFSSCPLPSIQTHNSFELWCHSRFPHQRTTPGPPGTPCHSVPQEEDGKSQDDASDSSNGASNEANDRISPHQVKNYHTAHVDAIGKTRRSTTWPPSGRAEAPQLAKLFSVSIIPPLEERHRWIQESEQSLSRLSRNDKHAPNPIICDIPTTTPLPLQMEPYSTFNSERRYKFLGTERPIGWNDSIPDTAFCGTRGTERSTSLHQCPLCGSAGGTTNLSGLDAVGCYLARDKCEEEEVAIKWVIKYSGEVHVSFLSPQTTNNPINATSRTNYTQHRQHFQLT